MVDFSARAMGFAGVLCVTLTGCMKPMEVVVPKDFHGTVQIHCSNMGTGARQVVVDPSGGAEATCPAVQRSITVLRDGSRVEIIGSPSWVESRDGEMKSIQLVVQ